MATRPALSVMKVRLPVVVSFTRGTGQPFSLSMILIWNGAAPERVGRKMRAMISDGSALNMCGNCMRDLRDQGRSLNNS